MSEARIAQDVLVMKGMSKETLVLLYGGRSAEREVSVLSAESVMRAINYDKFFVKTYFITQTGDFVKTQEFSSKPTDAEKINLKNIYTLENYLKSRFSVKDAQIKIERNTEFNIKNEWENIIAYINVKYPLTKAILINNSAEINEKNILIKLAVKGEDFLVASGFDKIIEKSILDFYNKEYKIKITENIDKELVKKYEENTKRIERMAIELAEQEITWEEEKPKQTKQENTPEKKNETNNEPKKTVKNENTVKEPAEPVPEEPKENTPLILGRSLNIKETLVKVEDLSIDSGKIALEGEIINMDSRELKSGKFLVMFDLYDGTSTITCKSFVVPEKMKEVTGRLKNAKGVKISEIGRAHV